MDATEFDVLFNKKFQDTPRKHVYYNPYESLLEFNTLIELEREQKTWMLEESERQAVFKMLKKSTAAHVAEVTNSIMGGYFKYWKNYYGFFNILDANHPNMIDNENPSLFMGQVFAFNWLIANEAHMDMPVTSEHWVETVGLESFIREWIDSITVYDEKEYKPVKGLYHRTPRSQKVLGIDDNISRDEYTGIVAMDYAADNAYIADLDSPGEYKGMFVDDILEYGEKWGGSFNDREGKPKISKDWARYSRQSGDYLYYKVTAGKRPSLIEMLWFFLSALISVLRVEKKGKEGFQASGIMMHSLRMETMLSLKDSKLKRYEPIKLFLPILSLFYTAWTAILRLQISKRKNSNDFNFYSEDYLWNYPMCAVSRVYFKDPSYPLNRLMEILFSYRRFKKEVESSWKLRARA